MSSLLFPALDSPRGRPAISLGELALTQLDLAAAVHEHLSGLIHVGVTPGDRVAVWTRPSIDTIVALIANALGGMVSVPLNPKLGTMELDHILRDCRPSLTVDGLLSAPAPMSSRTLPAREVDDTPLLILYTSGTTGSPKGAVLSARSVAANLDGLAEAWGWTHEDTIVHSLPLFHVHGLVLGLFGCTRRGGNFRWIPRFDPSETARALEETSGMLFAVPTMYHRLADAAERNPSLGHALGCARRLISGSAGLPVREHRRIESLTGKGIYERYGLTETLICCAVPGDGPHRPGYVGPAVPGVELRLVDDARVTVEARDDLTIAEVAVRGPSVFSGYLDRPEATAAVLDEDGWFYTGDLATRTEDGAIRIVGRRATDLIKTGGYKVGAGEVEACLLEAAGVAETAVVGVPDDDLGERIIAYVVARPGTALEERALIDHVATQLTPHKRPRAVRFVDELPRNAMGKVQKRRLPPG
jgi:malonyl-CoA/methylmalonyl-CoA synthetase